MSSWLDKALFIDLDPTAGTQSIDVALGQNVDGSRHQLHLTVKPEGSAGTITIKGTGRGYSVKPLAPSIFDSRFQSINMAQGSRIFVFYGAFLALHFDFAGFAAGKKVSAVLTSQAADLLISGNGP